jgi:hypothetical protein
MMLEFGCNFVASDGDGPLGLAMSGLADASLSDLYDSVYTGQTSALTTENMSCFLNLFIYRDISLRKSARLMVMSCPYSCHDGI